MTLDQISDRKKTDQTPFAFLSHDGDAAARICAFDWSDTSVGPIFDWPASLKAIVGFLIQSTVPMVLLWGRDGVMIYNDAYSVFAGARHPAALGCKIMEGWPEVAEFNENVMQVDCHASAVRTPDEHDVLVACFRQA